MTQKEIQYKLDTFYSKVFREDNYYTLTQALKEAFNLGLEVAAENVEFDTFTLSESAEIQLHKLIMNNELEIGVIRNSILQHKLKI